MLSTVIILFAGLALGDVGTTAKVPSPEEALRLVQIAPGYRLELAACEPEIQSPVAAVFDEKARLWIVEMIDYPTGPGPGETAQSRIRVLEDTDSDGRFEKSHVFADGLLFPTGLAHWKGGVYVTTMRAVLYLADTDGDGRADERKVVFEGFKDENTQLLPNHPTWSIDNHLYFANGLRATDVRRGGEHQGDELRGEPRDAISIRGRDFRLDPLTGQVEAVSGHSQFGLAFDDEGSRFNCSNRNHLQHVVIEARYAERCPGAAISELVEDIPDHEAAAQIFPLSRNWTTSNLHQGTFTAACGVHVYRGDLLPGLKGDSFTCDPTGNLVHRDRLTRSGGTFVASRVEEKAEFLRSPSEWFRPVNLATGPDGALYVVDMCRSTIEHPHWMPPEMVNRSDFTAGRDRGRIWRVAPTAQIAGEARRAPVRLDGDDVTSLASAFSSSNGFLRDTAQRLAVERQTMGVVPALRELAAHGRDAAIRLQALWTLEGLHSLATEELDRALTDTDARVRRTALRLAEPLFHRGEGPTKRATDLVRDPDPSGRFQLALTLGEIDPTLALEPLTLLGVGDVTDRWWRLAILSSAKEPHFLAARILMKDATPEAGRPQLVRELARMSASSDMSTGARPLLAAVQCVREPYRRAWRRIVALALLDAGLDRTRLDAAQAQVLADAIREAELDAFSAVSSLADRVEATRLIAHSETGSPVLERIIDTAAEPELKAAAARALLRTDDPAVATRLLSRWPSATPTVRRAMVDALISRPALAGMLLSAVESGAIKPAELDPPERNRLLHHSDAAVKSRSEAALGKPSADRARVIERYQGALKAPSDMARGRGIFQKTCAVCHRAAGLGVDTGPDISDTRDRSPESLLVDILDPNRAIDGRYVSYSCTTKDGRIFSGVIAAETASSVTLKAAEARTETVLKPEIASLESSGLSLMPEGLEKDVSVQDMTDLIAFLKGWRYEDRP